MTKQFTAILLTGVLAGACSFSVSTGGNTETNNKPANSATPATGAANSNTAKPADTATPAAKEAVEKKTEDKGASPEATEERIQFAPGKTEANIDRTIAPGVNKMFLFNAKKNQTLSFNVEESTGQLEVDFNKNPVELGQEVVESLNASGDWAIYVSNPTNKPLKYRLSIGIQ